jgi:hypothetical protein
MSRPALTGRTPVVRDSGNNMAARAKIRERTMHGHWRLDFNVPNP